MQNSFSNSHITGRSEGKKRVLILSDDPQLAVSLSLYFGDEFDVQTVENFDHARDVIKRDNADLLLIDFGIPHDRIPRSLSSIHRQKKVPIVMMYVFHEKKAALENEIRKYADAIFYKPVNLLDVLGKIRLFLS